jgi:hypothetical protein
VANFNKQQTGLSIIQDACGQLGLPVPIAAASNPSDVTARQMLAQLTYAGRRLVKPTNTYRWNVLLRNWVLITDPLVTVYPMPEDFDSFEDLTGWNFSSRLPMLGPATDPQWMTLKARNLGSSTISVIYRSRGGKFEIYNTFPDPQELQICYSSRAWVQSGADPLVFKDWVETDDDIVLFDPDLMVAADTDAPVLTFNANDTYPLISTQFNAPDTGYGL